MISILFCALIAIASVVGLSELTSLQGIEYMIVSYDVLSGENVQEIFDLTFSGRTVCHKGICYNIPDQFDFYDLNECDTRGKTEVITSREEWEETYSTKVTISMDAGLFSSVSGSHSSEYKEYQSTTNEHQSATTNVYIGCDEFELVVRPTTLKLSENIYADIFKLSLEFNDESREDYYNFFRKYGTVWVYRAVLGGRMNGNAFTEYTYLKTVDEVTMTEQMTASFFAQITHETQYTSKLTKEYNESTHTYEVATFGGSYFDPSDRDITTWTSTIHTAPVPVFKEFYPIIELFNGIWVYDSSLVKYYAPIKLAIEAFLNISGCIDSIAQNYNPEAVVDDGSCLFIHEYTNEYMITSQTVDPANIGIKMVHSSEAFCYLTYNELCESQCRVQIDDVDGFWYVRAKRTCTASPDKYCGARCTYTYPMIAPAEENPTQGQVSTNGYMTYLSYNQKMFRLTCSIMRHDHIMHSSNGFCYLAYGDWHETQCQVGIDEDGYWFITAKWGASGHDCNLPYCDAFCANIKYEPIKNLIA